MDVAFGLIISSVIFFSSKRNEEIKASRERINRRQQIENGSIHCNTDNRDEKDVSKEDGDDTTEMVIIKKEINCIESYFSKWDIENDHIPSWWWFFQQQSSLLSKENRDFITYERNLLRLQDKVNATLRWR